MQDDTSVILLASNLSQTAPRTSRFKEFAAKFSTIIENSDFNGILRPFPVYSNSDILEGLLDFSAKTTVFHFEGRSENYQALLEAARASPIKDLPTYLGGLKKLRFVFLSGCATEAFTDALLDSGVPAVITSSHALSLKEIELFSDTVYEQLLGNATLQAAFEVAKKSLGVEKGSNQRIFIAIKGKTEAREWMLPSPRIIGNSQGKSVGIHDNEKTSNRMMENSRREFIENTSTSFAERGKTEYAEKPSIPEWFVWGDSSIQNPMVSREPTKSTIQGIPSNRAIVRLLSHTSKQHSSLIEENQLVQNAEYLLQVEIILSDYERKHLQQVSLIARERLIAVTVYSQEIQIRPSRFQSKSISETDTDIKFNFELKPVHQGKQYICIDIYENRNWVSAIEFDVTIL